MRVPKYLCDVFAIRPRETVDDAGLLHMILLDVLRNLDETTLVALLRTHLVVEVLTVEGQLEMYRVPHAEAGHDVLFNLRICSRSQGTDGHVRIQLPKLGELGVLRKEVSSLQRHTVEVMKTTYGVAEPTSPIRDTVRLVYHEAHELSTVV